MNGGYKNYMKVGILTWFFAANYGAKAHVLALQQQLINLKMDVEVINFTPDEAKGVNLRTNVAHPIKTHVDTVINGIIRCRKFNKFNKNYRLSKKVKNASEIDALGYDLIILGSDEVFNIIHPIFNSVYFGVGMVHTPCISYAPSMGQMPINMPLNQKLINSLTKMKSISVRDAYSESVLQKYIQNTIKIVCDPTFLFDFKPYYKTIKNKNYILIYSFDNLNEYAGKIRSYAKENSLTIVTIGRKSTWSDYSYSAASEYLWLGSFVNATLVITDSFHGTVFAIKNKVNYVIMDRVDKTNKIQGLHNYLGIKKDFYNGEDSLEQYINKNNIDYDIISINIAQRVDESREYLEKALKIIR